MESLNRVIISRSALAYNFDLFRGQAGSAGVMALVKADGYGHGMIAVLYTLLRVHET